MAGFENDLNTEWAYPKMASLCFYCLGPGGGLDRMDNNLGHSESNTVPCCEQCNRILGDIPFEAKKLLSAGLMDIRRAGLLEGWVIPTKRCNTKK